MISKFWKDSVGGNLIAAAILSLLTSLISKMESNVNNFIDNKLFPFEADLNIKYLLFFLLLFLLYFLIFYLIRQISLFINTGKPLNLKKALQRYSNLKKVAVIGKSEVGKTTLISRFCRIENDPEQTQGKYAYPVNFSRKWFNFALMLDANGESTALQLSNAIIANYVLVLLDHNWGDGNANLNSDRIQENKMFLSRLSDSIDNSDSHKISYICIIMNKHDLWAEKIDEATFYSNYEDEINVLKKINGRPSIKIFYHSNIYSKDVTKLINHINSKI